MITELNKGYFVRELNDRFIVQQVAAQIHQMLSGVLKTSAMECVIN